MDQSMSNGGGKNMCGCPHHKAIPVLLILLGLLFLLGDWNVVSQKTVTVGWPVLLILIGFTKMMKSNCKCC